MTNSHSRIKALKCFEEVKKRLGAGETYGKVAQYVHGQGEMIDLDLRSVEQAIRRFAKAYPGLVLTKDPVQARAIEVLHGETPKYIQEWQEGLTERLDALWEMENLYRAQLGRVIRLVLAEEEEAAENKKYILQELRPELKQVFQMAKDVAGLQMDLNILERAPTRLDARVAKYEQKLDLGQVLLELLKDSPDELKGLLQEDKLKELARLELLEEMDSE